MTTKKWSRHQIWLHPDHMDTLKTLYPQTSASRIIRLLIDEHIQLYGSGLKRESAPKPESINLELDYDQ